MPRFSGCSSVGSGDDGEMSYTPHSSYDSTGSSDADAVWVGEATLLDGEAVPDGVACGERVGVGVLVLVLVAL